MLEAKAFCYLLVLVYRLTAVCTESYNGETSSYDVKTLTLTETTDSILENSSPMPCNDSKKNVYGTCYCGPWSGKGDGSRDLERKVLDQIYHATNGDHWNNYSLWLVNGTDHCQWYGICCNQQGFVSKILLYVNNMTGHLPDVSRLEYLDCLNVNSNRLKGNLIDFLKPNMTNLQNLTISFNNFSGFLEGALIRNMPLHFVQLSLNPNITGDLPIELCDKTNLTVLSVGETAITGAIPECLGENKPHLRFLDFEYTKMKSRYPESLLELKAIQWLHMSQMGLYGELPANFGENYPILAAIMMANNNVTGILPESVGYLKNLTLFDMSFNAIHGKIPENFTVLQNLSSFSLKGNQITSLPSKAFEYETLRYLDLSQNPLNATFSDVCTFIQACSQLAWLNLSDTGLKGHLDRALYNFVYMNSIDLSHNRLSGRIPLTTRDMPFLTNFDLSNNNLRGELPSTYVIMSALRYLNIRNNAKMRSHSGRLDSGLFTIDENNMVNAKSGNFSCPSVSLVKRNTAECFVDMDPNYYDYHQCTCNEHFFGERGRCRRCLDRGTCPGKAVVSNMTWPSNYWPSPSPYNVGRFEKCSVSEAEDPVCNVNGTCQCHLHIDEYKNEENIVCDEACICKSYHAGRLCSQCASEKYYQDSKHTCRPCHQDAYKVLTGISSMTVFCIIIAWFVRWRVKRQTFIRTALTSGLQVALLLIHLILCALGHAPFWGFQLTFIVVVANLSGLSGNSQGILNGFVFYVQLLDATLRTYPVAPKEIYEMVYVVRDAFSFQLSSLKCVMVKLYEPPGQLIIMLVLPIISIALLVILIVTGALVYYCYHSRKDQRDALGERTPLLQANEHFNIIDWRPFWKFAYHCGGVAVFVLTLLYFPIIKLSLMALTICDADEATGFLYMHNYPNVRCQGYLWRTYLRLSSVSLAIYGVLTPAVFGVILKIFVPKRRRLAQITDPSAHIKRSLENIDNFLGKFFKPYKSGFEYVEIGYIFRKLCLATLFSCVPQGSALQPVSIAVVFAICIQLHNSFRPFQGTLENFLEGASLWTLLFTVSCAGYLYLANVDVHNNVTIVFILYALVVLNSLVFVSYIISLLYRLSDRLPCFKTRAKREELQRVLDYNPKQERKPKKTRKKPAVARPCSVRRFYGKPGLQNLRRRKIYPKQLRDNRRTRLASKRDQDEAASIVNECDSRYSV